MTTWKPQKLIKIDDIIKLYMHNGGMKATLANGDLVDVGGNAGEFILALEKIFIWRAIDSLRGICLIG